MTRELMFRIRNISTRVDSVVVPIGNKREWIKAECLRLSVEILQRSYGYD